MHLKHIHSLKWLVYISLLSLSTQLMAQTVPEPAQPAQPQPAQSAHDNGPFAGIEIIQEQLPNGLTVILNPDRRLPVVAVEMRYLVGSAHEVEGRSGFAHLFEHLMFQGSKSYDHEYFDPFVAIGGEVNGTTDTDRTNYYEQVPAQALELALWMESDRMEGLLEALTQQKLDNQRDVVKNERRQRYENTPYGMVWKVLYESLYPIGHPYQHTTIGSHEDLTAASLEDVKAFFKRYYVPANAVLTISGDFELNDARALAYQYFGHMPSGQRAARPVATFEAPKQARLIEIEDQQIKLPRIYLAWPTAALYEKGDSALDIWSTILTDGKNSRLYRPLVYEQKIFKDIQAFQASSGLSSMFVIQGTVNPDHKIEDASKALAQAIESALAKPIQEDEFQKALNGWRKGFYGRVESVLNRAQMFSNYYHFTGKANYLNEDLNRYLSLKPSDVHEEARKTLSLKTALQLHVVLSGQSKKSSVDRTKVPVVKEAQAWTPPTYKTWQTKNGLDVWFVEQKQAPLLTMQLILPYGSSSDLKGKAGLTALTLDLMDEGANGKDALALSDAFQKLATDYSFETQTDQVIFHLNLLSEQLKPSLSLFADLLTKPNLNENDFERIKKQRIASAMSSLANPKHVRDLLMRKVLFTDGYASYPNDGTQESLNNINLADVKDHYQQLIKPSKATLIVVGKIDESTLNTAIEESFAHWEGQSQLATHPISTSNLQKSAIHWVDFPGSSQSAISLVKTVQPKSDRMEEYANLLFNQVFGGEFSSRLNMNLREDKGYTYGAYSSLVEWQKIGLWMISTMVKAETTKASIQEILKEISQIQSSKKIMKEELENMRNGLIKGYPSRFESLGSIAGELGHLKIKNKSKEDLQNWPIDLTKLSLDQIQNRQNDLIDLQKMQIFVVGDYQQFKNDFKDLGLEILLYEANGQLKSNQSK